MAASKVRKRYNETGKLLQNTTIKVRLHPTARQAEVMEKTFGCCRYLWNRILSDEEEFYAATGVHFLPTPARYKKEAPFLKEVDSIALATVHQNLRQAFQNFFSKPDTYGHPVYKRKKDNKNSYTVFPSTTAKNVYLTEEGIRLPKVEVVKARFHRRPLHWWKLKSVTISRTPSGKYYGSLLFECPVREPERILPRAEGTLGINYSISHFYVDSDGYTAHLPEWIRTSQAKLKKMQQRLSRMKQGSKHYEEQLQRIRLLHEHIANQRKDFLHKESRRIANACDAVCVRDSDLRVISQKLKLGNGMESGFGMFRVYLDYKLTRMGKELVVVDKYTPTARTCHSCGHIRDELTIRERTWVCPSCGVTVQREVNAARNIRDRGLEQFYDRQAIA